MKYCCLNCNRIFLHPAKLIETQPSAMFSDGSRTKIGDAQTETSVCPICLNKTYEEIAEVAEDIANVYIYDLTTGPQTALDHLLAEGYKIVNRYSKQYHLEKPKEAKA
jgi:hypothetical protein